MDDFNQHIIFGLVFCKSELCATFNEELFGQRLCCLRIDTFFLFGIWVICGISLTSSGDYYGMIRMMLSAVIIILLVVVCWWIFHSRSWILNRTNLVTLCYLVYALLGLMPFYILLYPASRRTQQSLYWLLIAIQITTALLLYMPFGMVLFSACLSLTAMGMQQEVLNKHVGMGVPTTLFFEASALLMGLVLIYLVQHEVFTNFIIRQKRLATAEENVELRAQELKRAYLREMIHEIGTPLMVLSLGNESLKDIGKSCHEAIQIVKSNCQAIEMLTRLRERALDITKQGDGIVLSPKYEKVNIRHLVYKRCSRIMTAFNSSSSYERVQVTYHVNENVPKYISSDQDFIWDMLCCLLSNAKKFTNKGKIQTVVSYLEDERSICFQVSDTGRGVDEENQSLLFKPFSQFQSGAGGTGLGLYSVKLKAEALNGKIGYAPLSDHPDTTAGLEGFRTGSVFWFSIPYLPIEGRLSVTERQEGRTSLGKLSRYRSSSLLSSLDKRSSSSLPDNNRYVIDKTPNFVTVQKPRSFSIQRKKVILPSFTDIPNASEAKETLKTEESYADLRPIISLAPLKPVQENPSLRSGCFETVQERSACYETSSPKHLNSNNQSMDSEAQLRRAQISPLNLKSKAFFCEEPVQTSQSSTFQPRVRHSVSHRTSPDTEIIVNKEDYQTELASERTLLGPGVTGRSVLLTMRTSRVRQQSSFQSDSQWRDGDPELRTLLNVTGTGFDTSRPILLIEDEVTILKMMTRMLKKQGYTVDTAENGKVGLQKLIDNPYTCVFCDITMPEMDGYETLERFRAWEKHKDPATHQYICALSANSDETSQSKARSCGFDNFLTKPTNFKVILEEIEKAQVFVFSNGGDASNHI